MDRYPIEDRELPEWVQRQIEDADPLPAPWSYRRRLGVMIATCALIWALLILAMIGATALFGQWL